MSQRAWGFVLLALSMCLVGSYVALSKSLVAVFPVFLLALMRFAIGGLAMPHWLRRPADEPPMTASTKRWLFVESLLGNFLFSICMLYGVSMTSALSAGVIMASIPAACAVLSWWFLKEHLTSRTVIAVVLAVTGIALVSLGKDSSSINATLVESSNHSMIGNLLLCAAVLCEASYAVIGKRLTGCVGAKRISSIINAWGLFLMLPLGLWVARDFDFAKPNATHWGLLAFYSLAASVWSVWLWMTGLKHVPASSAGVMTVLLPISTSVVAVLFLGESFSVSQAAAFVLAIAAVLLVTLPDKKLKAPLG